MILPFQERFEEKILSGEKIHSIRRDEKNRWRIKNKIHFVTNHRTKKQKCFKEGLVVRVSDISINILLKTVTIYGMEQKAADILRIFTIGASEIYTSKRLTLRDDEIELFAKNDGFDKSEEFFKFFEEQSKAFRLFKNIEGAPKEAVFFGKLIQWTNFSYYK